MDVISLLYHTCIPYFFVEIFQMVSHNITKKIFGAKECRFIEDEANYKENKHFSAC